MCSHSRTNTGNDTNAFKTICKSFCEKEPVQENQLLVSSQRAVADGIFANKKYAVGKKMCVSEVVESLPKRLEDCGNLLLNDVWEPCRLSL